MDVTTPGTKARFTLRTLLEYYPGRIAGWDMQRRIAYETSWRIDILLVRGMRP